MTKKKSSDRFRFAAASVLLASLVFLVPALLRRQDDSSVHTLYLLAVLIPCSMLLCGTILARMFSLDRMIMALVLWLCTAGIAALALSDPDAALTQSLHCGAALIALLIGGIMIRSLAPSVPVSVCAGLPGLLILLAGLFFSIQDLPLTEAALALLLISFASLFARQGPVSALLLGATVLALLLLLHNLADACFWGLVVLLLIFAADGRPIIVLSALAAVLLLFSGAFLLSPHPSVFHDSSALPMLTSLPVLGTETLPEEFAAADPDSLFLLLSGHYGLIFSGLTALLFLPLSLRGSTVAVSARTRFHAVLAMGITLFLSLRALAALLSFFGFLPLSGLKLPFLTGSLTDLCAELFLAGLLCGISGRNDADLAEDAHLAMLAK